MTKASPITGRLKTSRNAGVDSPPLLLDQVREDVGVEQLQPSFNHVELENRTLSKGTKEWGKKYTLT